MNLISTVIAFFATIPYITFFIIFYILKKMTNQSTRSTKIAADITTAFFILAVNALLYLIFEHSFLGWTIISFMVAALIIITVQWRIKTEVNFWRAARIVWRAGFVVLAIGYIILVPIGIYYNF